MLDHNISVCYSERMKPLLDYLNAMPVAAQEDFAKRCETTVGYLRQIAYGHRACPAHLAINIERESSRALICEELRPTGVDWAYIRAERRRKGVRRLIADRRNPPKLPE
jgi:DNA-binding transcriptional regulator YdaS (Cro superfamily)